LSILFYFLIGLLTLLELLKFEIKVSFFDVYAFFKILDPYFLSKISSSMSNSFKIFLGILSKKNKNYFYILDLMK
jgi:hypothetical protein